MLLSIVVNQINNVYEKLIDYIQKEKEKCKQSKMIDDTFACQLRSIYLIKNYAY